MAGEGALWHGVDYERRGVVTGGMGSIRGGRGHGVDYEKREVVVTGGMGSTGGGSGAWEEALGHIKGGTHPHAH